MLECTTPRRRMAKTKRLLKTIVAVDADVCAHYGFDDGSDEADDYAKDCDGNFNSNYGNVNADPGLEGNGLGNGAAVLSRYSS